MARDLAFLGSKPTAVVINGETINFYPLRLAALHQLKGLAKPISSAMSVLFAKNDTDQGRQWDEFANQTEGMASTKSKVEPITIDLARFRASQKEAAMAQLIESLTSPDTHTSLVLIVADSMRDEFPVTPRGAALEDLKTRFDIENLIELFKGVVEANKGVFGPLVGKVTEALKESTLGTSPLQQSPDFRSPRSQNEPESEPQPSNKPTPTSLASDGN